MDDLDQFYSSADRGVKPVFFKNNDVIVGEKGKNLTDYEVALCAARVVGRSMVECAQKIRGLWRIYVKEEAARTDILAQGLTIRSQHISLFQTNPYHTHPDDPKAKTVRITVKDLPISFSNDEVLVLMRKLNVTLTSQQVKYGYIRDEDDKLTDFKNGDRFVFADEESLMSKPLPRYAMCGIFEVRIFHRGQFGPPRCRNCLSYSHHTNDCTDEKVCKICEKPGHNEGSTQCEFYEPQTNITLVGGSKDLLSNMYPCNFQFMGVDVDSAEKAFQYGKAKRCKEDKLAEKILKAGDGFESKRLSKFIVTSPNWDRDNQDLMEDVLNAKFEQVEECANALTNTGMTRIVEAVYGSTFWGSGLDKEKTKRIKKSALPGENRLGAMLSRVRENIRASQRIRNKRPLSEDSANNGTPSAKCPQSSPGTSKTKKK